jgi:arylformamidase
MRLSLLLLGCLFIPTVAIAAEIPNPDPDIAIVSTGTETHKDLAFGPDALQKLDLYAPARAKKAPTVIFVHGGEWTKHDKKTVHYKPKAFNDMGVILVSTNYRLSPQSAHPAQVSDVAAAIAWVRNNVARYGGDPDNIFIMGHSAGCHLVTLVSLDPRYLQAVGMRPSNLRGVIAWSGGAYDLVGLVKKSSNAGSYGGYILKVFGEKEEAWKDASPIAHVADSRALPAYLFASVVPGASYDISRKMTELINATGVTGATSVLLEGKTHQSASTELGAPGDQSFAIIRGFLAKNATHPL